MVVVVFFIFSSKSTKKQHGSEWSNEQFGEMGETDGC
jgi:hypothetical protein